MSFEELKRLHTFSQGVSHLSRRVCPAKPISVRTVESERLDVVLPQLLSHGHELNH